MKVREVRGHFRDGVREEEPDTDDVLVAVLRQCPHQDLAVLASCLGFDVLDLDLVAVIDVCRVSVDVSLLRLGKGHQPPIGRIIERVVSAAGEVEHEADLELRLRAYRHHRNEQQGDKNYETLHEYLLGSNFLNTLCLAKKEVKTF